MGNAALMAYVVVSVSLAVSNPAPWSLVLGLSTASWLFANFLVHALTTLTSGVYSPGVVSAGALYVPVWLFVYDRAAQADLPSPSVLLWSVLIGFAVMYLLFLNAIRVAYQDRRREPMGDVRSR